VAWQQRRQMHLSGSALELYVSWPKQLELCVSWPKPGQRTLCHVAAAHQGCVALHAADTLAGSSILHMDAMPVTRVEYHTTCRHCTHSVQKNRYCSLSGSEAAVGSATRLAASAAAIVANATQAPHPCRHQTHGSAGHTCTRVAVLGLVLGLTDLVT
jgi:hypothetical protein